MPEFTNAQWAAQFGNTTVSAAISSLGTAISPIQVLDEALAAYGKAETIFNNAASGPPYLNSVSDPVLGAVTLNSVGFPVVPILYTVNIVKNFSGAKVAPRESTIII